MAGIGVVGLTFFAALIVSSSQDNSHHEGPYEVTNLVYLDMSIGGDLVKPNHRIAIGLFGKVVPRTVRNFVGLATNKLGFGYKGTGTPFHRVIQKFMIQGGDFEKHNGYGGYSIFKPLHSLFHDENYIIRHYGPGWVCMATAGPDTDGSQFVILTMPTPWSDNHYTCFGKVVHGMDVVKQIEFNPTDAADRPIKEVIITDSGTLPLDTQFNIERKIWGY